MFADLSAEVEIATDEVLDLGVFTDFDRLFDVISLAADQAEDWEEQLVPFDESEFEEPDVYDIYGADADDDDADLDEEDDDEDDADFEDLDSEEDLDPDDDADENFGTVRDEE
jgi:hypothetical protein